MTVEYFRFGNTSISGARVNLDRVGQTTAQHQAQVSQDPTLLDNTFWGVISVQEDTIFSHQFTMRTNNTNESLNTPIPGTVSSTELQTIRGRFHKVNGSGTVFGTITVTRTGQTLLAELGPFEITSTTGQLETLQFLIPADMVSGENTGDWIEITYSGTSTGGGPNARTTTTLSSIDWLVAMEASAPEPNDPLDLVGTPSMFAANPIVVRPIYLDGTPSMFAASRLDSPVPFQMIQLHIDLLAVLPALLEPTASSFASSPVHKRLSWDIPSTLSAFSAGSVEFIEDVGIRVNLIGTPRSTAYGQLTVSGAATLDPTASTGGYEPVAVSGAATLESYTTTLLTSLRSLNTAYVQGYASTTGYGEVDFVPSTPVDGTASEFAAGQIHVTAVGFADQTGSEYASSAVGISGASYVDPTLSSAEAGAIVVNRSTLIDPTSSATEYGEIAAAGRVRVSPTESAFAAGLLVTPQIATFVGTISAFSSGNLFTYATAELVGTGSTVGYAAVGTPASNLMVSTPSAFQSSELRGAAIEQRLESTVSRFAASTVSLRNPWGYRSYFVAHELWLRDPQVLWPAFVDKPVYRVDKSQPSRYAWTNYNQYRVDHSQPRYAIFDTVDYGVSFAEFE